MVEEKRSEVSLKLDVPFAEAMGKVVDKTADASLAGARATLSRLCLPAAEELGLLWKDTISGWRDMRMIAFVEKLEKRFASSANPSAMRAHPRLVHLAVNEASKIDEDDIQSMWAGLLAESANERGGSQENLLYMNLLKQLTSEQARILNYCCEVCPKAFSDLGVLVPLGFVPDLEELMSLSGYSRAANLVAAFDSMINIGLFNTATVLKPNEVQKVAVVPSSLALDLFVRCLGTDKSTEEYFASAPEWRNMNDNFKKEVILPHSGLVVPAGPHQHERT